MLLNVRDLLCYVWGERLALVKSKGHNITICHDYNGHVGYDDREYCVENEMSLKNDENIESN